MVPSKVRLRIPKAVTSSSTVVPPTCTLVSSWYMLGVARFHSLGFATGTSKVKPAEAPAAIVWAAVVTGASAAPLASLTIPCTVTLWLVVPEFTTVVVT